MEIQINDEDFQREGLGETVRDVLTKARIFGAAFIFVGADDGQAQEEPLVTKKVRAVRFLSVLTAKDLSKTSFYDDPTDSRYGHAKHYHLNTSNALQSAAIHESRLIPFFSIPPLNHRKFPPSILQRVYPVLQQFHTAWQSTAHLMTDAAQGVFKLKGLHSAVASNRS